MGLRSRLFPRALGLGISLGISLSLGLLGDSGPAEAAPESSAERLYRRGIHCMEEIERSECAIEHFEGLLDENTRERALITDAILRLVKLYRKEGLEEPMRQVLRRFWEAGGRRHRTGHLPYSARFLPSDLDVVAHVDVQMALAAPLLKRLPPELSEAMTTCDEVRREALADALMVRQAQHRSTKKSITTEAALAELRKEEAERRDRYKETEAKRKANSETAVSAPVFAESLCAAALALGTDSAEKWSRAAFALSYKDPRRSAAIVVIPGLAAQIEAGVAAGRLRPVASKRWVIVDHSYEEAPVEIGNFDLDELTIAPAALMPDFAATIERGKPTLNREVAKLVTTTPKDLIFFAVITGEVIRGIGIGGKSSRRGLLGSFLPEGFQIAATTHEYLGVFMRMPAKNPVRIKLLIDLATRFLLDEHDEETAKMLKNLDVAQAADKRALLISYVLSPSQIQDLIFQ